MLLALLIESSKVKNAHTIFFTCVSSWIARNVLMQYAIHTACIFRGVSYVNCMRCGKSPSVVVNHKLLVPNALVI